MTFRFLDFFFALPGHVLCNLFSCHLNKENKSDFKFLFFPNINILTYNVPLKFIWLNPTYLLKY